MAAYAPITYIKSEASALFDIPFDYLSQKFIVVLVDDVLNTYGVDYDFLDKSRVRFLKGNIPAGTRVTLKRNTNAASKLVSWKDASVLKAGDLELSQLQLLHVAEEANSVAGTALLPDWESNWDALGKRLTNLEPPLLAQDGATKEYADGLSANGSKYTDTQIKRVLRGASLEVLKELPAASSRANKVMGFDSIGNPIGVLPASGSGTELAIDLANPTDPSKGIGMLAYPRTRVALAVSSASRLMSALRVNVWEVQFVMLITYKPTDDPNTWDWTPAYEAASKYVKSVGGGVVELTEGIFSFTRIYRRNGVSIECRGSSATYLQALPFDPGDGKPYGMIEQEAGPVISSHIRGVHLLGNPLNPNQWGMYLHAQWDVAYQHGGLWMAVHDDVRVTFFNKGIWSRGGYTVAHYRRPQQFLDFRSVYVQVPNGGEAMRFTGQHGQVNLLLGSAEGRDGNVALMGVKMAFDPEPSTTADNASGYGESTADVPGVGNAVQAPLNMNLLSAFSVQKSQQGYYLQGAKAVLLGNYIENIGKLITAVNNSHVTISDCHIAKGAQGSMFGSPGSGYLYSIQSNSTLVWLRTNNITGQTDNNSDPAVSINNTAGMHIELTYYNGDTTGKFKALGYKSVGIDAAGKVSLGGHRDAILSSNTDLTILLKTLNANAAPGEDVTLRANSGPITLGVGGNISLNGLSAITIPQFGSVVLKRIYEVGVSGEWRVIYVSDHSGSGAPSSGYYAVGTRIWRSNPSGGSFAGVVCTIAGIAGSTAVFKNMAALSA